MNVPCADGRTNPGAGKQTGNAIFADTNVIQAVATNLVSGLSNNAALTYYPTSNPSGFQTLSQQTGAVNGFSNNVPFMVNAGQVGGVVTGPVTNQSFSLSGLGTITNIAVANATNQGALTLFTNIAQANAGGGGSTNAIANTNGFGTNTTLVGPILFPATLTNSVGANGTSFGYYYATNGGSGNDFGPTVEFGVMGYPFSFSTTGPRMWLNYLYNFTTGSTNLNMAAGYSSILNGLNNTNASFRFETILGGSANYVHSTFALNYGFNNVIGYATDPVDSERYSQILNGVNNTIMGGSGYYASNSTAIGSGITITNSGSFVANDTTPVATKTNNTAILLFQNGVTIGNGLTVQGNLNLNTNYPVLTSTNAIIGVSGGPEQGTYFLAALNSWTNENNQIWSITNSGGAIPWLFRSNGVSQVSFNNLITNGGFVSLNGMPAPSLTRIGVNLDLNGMNLIGWLNSTNLLAQINAMLNYATIQASNVVGTVSNATTAGSLSGFSYSIPVYTPNTNVLNPIGTGAGFYPATTTNANYTWNSLYRWTNSDTTVVLGAYTNTDNAQVVEDTDFGGWLCCTNLAQQNVASLLGDYFGANVILTNNNFPDNGNFVGTISFSFGTTTNSVSALGGNINASTSTNAQFAAVANVWGGATKPDGLTLTTNSAGILADNRQTFLPTTLFGVGDSITVGWGSSCPNTSAVDTNVAYIYQVANRFGAALSNQCANAGQTSLDTEYQLWYQTHPVITTNSIVIYDIGVNDASDLTTNGNYINTFQGIELCELAWLSFMGSEAQITGQNIYNAVNTTNGSLVGTGWNKVPGWAHFNDITTTNAGDYVLLTNVFGRSFVLAYDAWTNGASGGTFNVYCDSNLLATVSSSCLPAPGHTEFSQSNCILGQVFSGLSSGYHTITLSNISGDFGFSSAVFPDMQSYKVPVYDMETYYPQPSSAPVNSVNMINAVKRANDLALNAIGLPVQYVPTKNYMGTNFCDGLHPSEVGHGILANRLAMAMSTPWESYSPALATLAGGNGGGLTNVPTGFLHMQTNTAPSNVAIGVTAPDGFITNYVGGNLVFQPYWKNH